MPPFQAPDDTDDQPDLADANHPNQNFDFTDQIKDMGELLQQQKLDSEGTIKGLKGDLDANKATMDRLRKALSNEPDKVVSESQRRISAFEALAFELDEAALDDQRRGGKGLPLTTKIGKQLSEFARNTLAENEKLREQIAKIEGRQNLQDNTAYQSLQKINHTAETFIDEALSTLYGADEANEDVRGFQAQSINTMIKKEIKGMLDTNDYASIKALSNPKNVRSMVNHFMAQILPPKVRQMMDDDRIKNEPDNPAKLMSALKEANKKVTEAQTQQDYDFWVKTATELRQSFLAAKNDSKKGGGINAMLG